MVATSSDTRGDLGRYVLGREVVLGGRTRVSLGDPAVGADELAEALGGRALARQWLRDALAALEPRVVA